MDSKINYLEVMMGMQEVLNTNVIDKLELTHYDPSKMKDHLKLVGVDDDDSRRRVAVNRRVWADDFMSALQSEVCETREALTQRVKWWKNKTKDSDGIKEEIIDCWHFLMSASLAMGMDAEEVFSRYVEKNKANFTREDWDVNKVVK